jgi:hypothetical protein
MTDNNTLADNNIKHFGKLSTCYEYLTDIDSESIPSCYDRVCLECGNDHAITSIDMLPALFKDGNACKLQEFLN